MTHTQLAIVGGGIAGLSAAYYAQQNGLDYTLLEASPRWGGKIQTETVDAPFGTVRIEVGPDSFITQKPWALQLARELGIESQLLSTNDAHKGVFVYSAGRLRPLPEGMMLIIPTKFMPFARSSLISPLGKLRMGLEPFLPARTDAEDESLADFIRRRLGQEALDKLAEPLMSGIYNTDVEAQSLLATFPRLRQIEAQHGSLTGGMLAAKRKRPAPTGNSKISTFVSFRDGMSTLVDTLVEQLRGDLRLNCGVEALQTTAYGYALTLMDGTTLDAQQVLLAVPSYRAAALLANLQPSLSKQLSAISYVNTGTINLVYKADDIPATVKGYGAVIPRSADRAINAITLSSRKFDHRVPDGYLLMRVFYGGVRSPQTFEQDDAQLLQTVQHELKLIYGIEAEPCLSRIKRNHRATAQYNVGHLERISALEAALPHNLWLTGSAYHGVGVPDCIHEAQQTVEQIAQMTAQPALSLMR